MESLQEKNLTLLKRAQNGDEDAKEILVSENSRLIYSIAKRFTSRGYDLEDLYQLGAIGLIKAIKNFDLTLGLKFSTYAVPLILGEIKRFLRDDGLIKVSRNHKTLAVKIKAVADKIKNDTGKDAKVSELSEVLGVKSEDILLSLEATKPVESLYAPSKSDEKLLLIDKISGGVDNENDTVNKIALFELLKKLPEREQTVIYLRYFKDETQSRIAQKMGISQVQVSRIEKKVIENLREKMM
ncbi:MAG: SigB/SigF/SigG family RNA polymerase sigma factor [Clostridia bacterium]|nr:SigB/SigF/SigG family RNA polymerase sigma factor [Clostridia bacterium]